MKHSLVRYYEKVHGIAEKFANLLDFESPDGGTREVQDIHESIFSLAARTKSPEIKVLLLGPLKSGKSTLMNILLKNPEISQISPFPAYPCFVEVRDVERDEAGGPVEKSRSILHSRAGRIQEFTHQEMMQYLDNLLYKFMGTGEDEQHEIEYDKVTQKIEMSPALHGLNLVIVDSPGLFFSRRIDDGFFDPAPSVAQEGAESAYSHSTHALYSEADVAIFVVRPEQLFFENVADWLRRFMSEHKITTFILVNASTRSKTQDGKKIVDYDQVEHGDEIKKYFILHVASNDLAASIEKNKIRLLFADLLDAATVEFADGDREDFQSTTSGQNLEKITEFITGDQLATKKCQSIDRLVKSIAKRATAHLDRTLEARDRERNALEAETVILETKIATGEEELARLKGDRANALSSITRYSDRSALLADFVAGGEIPVETDDEEMREFLEIRSLPLTESAVDFARSKSNELQKYVGSVYREWRKKNSGERSLLNLSNLVWENLQEGRASLRQELLLLLRHAATDLLSRAQSAVCGETLSAALRRVKTERLEFQTENPLRKLQDKLPIFHFNPRQKWKLLGKLTPEKLWGINGREIIVSEVGDSVLVDEEASFIGNIWHQPWHLKFSFTPEELSAKARNVSIAAIAESWQAVIEEHIGVIKRQVEEIERGIEVAQGDLSQLLESRDLLRRKISALLAARRDLEERHAQLIELGRIVKDWQDSAPAMRDTSYEGPGLEMASEDPAGTASGGEESFA